MTAFGDTFISICVKLQSLGPLFTGSRHASTSAQTPKEDASAHIVDLVIRLPRDGKEGFAINVTATSGWLGSLRNNTDDLGEYCLECYNEDGISSLLFERFTISRRRASRVIE